MSGRSPKSFVGPIFLLFTKESTSKMENAHIMCQPMKQDNYLLLYMEWRYSVCTYCASFLHKRVGTRLKWVANENVSASIALFRFDSLESFQFRELLMVESVKTSEAWKRHPQQLKWEFYSTRCVCITFWLSVNIVDTLLLSFYK